MISQDKHFTPGYDRIFVFGSNLAGIHGGGAALDAYQLYGAQMGIGEGLSGSTYAIPTKDAEIRTRPLSDIETSVQTFLRFADSHPQLQFFVTRIGCGLAGYTDGQIAPMFLGAPDNCELPTGWPDVAEQLRISRNSLSAKISHLENK